jgi:hypothetical protein
MERVWGHVLTGLTLVAGMGAAAGLVPACVHDNSTIFVSNVLASKFVTSGMQCIFTADPTQPVISEGTLDVGLTLTYTAEVLVGNQLVPRGDPNQPHTETSFVTIEGAVIRIVDSNGNQLNTYTQPVAATIPPSSGTNPGYAPMSITIVDSSTAKRLTPAIGASVPIVSFIRVFGHTLGGESVESNEFGFPIEVCTGCLVEFGGSCPMPGATMTSGSSTSLPCLIGQDLPVCATALSSGVSTIVDAGGGG